MAKRSTKSSATKSAKKTNKRSTAKNSLVANINKRKKAKTSRTKRNSTVSSEAYEQMQEGWPKKRSAKKKGRGTAKKSATKKSTATNSKSAKTKKQSKKSRTSKKAKHRSSPLKAPEGGLTAAGRRAFNEKDGSNLKPGVKGPADTPEKMRRKGSFLRRHFASLRGPLVDDTGQPTRLALQANAWGEAVPKTIAAAKKLAEKGSKLLERYQHVKASAK